AERLGYHSQIVLSGREINDGMGQFVANATIKRLIEANKIVKQAKVVVLGVTFKENTPDIRNSKVGDIITELKNYSVEPIVVDPYADQEATMAEYDIQLSSLEQITDADCVIFAVAHDIFKEMSWDQIDNMFGDYQQSEKIIIDVKSILNKSEL